MSKFLRVGTVLLVAILAFVGHTISAKASSDLEGSNLGVTEDGKVLVEELPDMASFDLTKGEKQEITYVNESGEEVTHGIEPIVEVDDPSLFCINNCSNPIKKGTTTFNVYTYTGAVNMSYKVKVARPGNAVRIVDAYDLSVNLVGYTESNRKFEFNSRKAEYSGTITLFGVFPVQMSIYLVAEIEGTNLVTYAKG